MKKERLLNCGSCTYCCKKTLIPVTDDEASMLKTTFQYGFNALKQKENGDCVYLDNNCTIYAVRPEVCRVYNCIGFHEMAKRENLKDVLKDKSFMNAVDRAIKRNR